MKLGKRERNLCKVRMKPNEIRARSSEKILGNNQKEKSSKGIEIKFESVTATAEQSMQIKTDLKLI